MTSPQALIVEDEPQMVSIISFTLETQGFTCLSARTVSEAWEVFQSNRVDLLIVDVMLPQASGLELTRRARARYPELPIIVLSALGEEQQRIAGLEAGANDYVTKPFSPRELALRAEGLLRFSGAIAPQNQFTAGALEVDLAALRVYWDDILVPLSATEVRVLGLLVRRHGQVVSFMDLLSEAWETSEPHGGREMIKTTIYRLRKKLAAAGVRHDLIDAVRGEGYVLNVK